MSVALQGKTLACNREITEHQLYSTGDHVLLENLGEKDKLIDQRHLDLTKLIGSVGLYIHMLSCRAVNQISDRRTDRLEGTH